MDFEDILARLQAWLDGGDPGDLPDHLEKVENLIRQIGNITEQNLKLEHDATLELALRGLHVSSLELEVALDELLPELRAGHREAVGARMEGLANAIAGLNRQQSAVWSAVPRCPRCQLQGDGEDWLCANCGLDLLYPNSSGPLESDLSSLAPEYRAVYDCYSSILSGGASLSGLKDVLEPLRLKLQAQGSPCAERGLDGIDIMDGVQYTRLASDLDDGWALIAECAAAS